MKKIMFNDKYGLTEAVLSGRKTQTRRIIPQSVIEKVEKFGREYFAGTLDNLTGIDLFNHYFFTEKLGRVPFSVGEVVASGLATIKQSPFNDTEVVYHLSRKGMETLSDILGIAITQEQ